MTAKPTNTPRTLAVRAATPAMSDAAYANQSYVRLLAEARAAGHVLAAPRTVAGVLTCHDDWCELLNGRGPCNCEPELEFSP
jgi:hypothetical protein